jgi:hypothetical protein
VVTVGYATGLQPVQVAFRSGAAPAGPAPWDTAAPAEPGTAPQAGRLVTVGLDVPAPEPVTLVVGRWDGAAGLTVTITVGFAPASWGTATAVMLIAGGFALLAGLALLVLRRPWIDPLHPMVADLDDDDAPPSRPADHGDAAPAPAPPRAPRIEPKLRWPVNTRANPDAGGRPARTVESPYVHTAT